MASDSGSAMPSGGREIFQNLMKSSSLSSSVKAELAEHTGRIYSIIDTKTGSLDDLNLSIILLTNLFRTHTHSSHSELTPTEKLMFQYAFTDITDDVRAALVDRADVLESYQEEQSTLGWLAAKVMGFVAGPEEKEVSAREILDGINKFQEAMKDPELEISMSQVKELLGIVLVHEGDGSEAKKLQEMDLIQLVAVLEQKHKEKVQNAEQRLKKGHEGAETSYLQMAFDTLGEAIYALSQVDVKEEIEKLRQPLVLHKDKLVRERVAGFKPEAMYKGRTFSKVVTELVDSNIQSSRLRYKPFSKIAKSMAESVRKNFAENLKRISDERNLARVCLKTNEKIGKVLDALYELDADSTDEELLAKLGYRGTVEQYKVDVESRGAENIAKLISRNPAESKTEYINIALKIWRKITTSFMNVRRKIIRFFYEKLVKDKESLSFMQSFIPMTDRVGGLKGVAEVMGMKGEIEKLEKHSDIILLYVLEGLVEEMADIAAESEGRDDPNVSGFATKEEAGEALRFSVAELGKKISSTTPKESSTLPQKCLFQFVSLFGPTVAQAQGTGDSVFDLVTPAFQELGPAWRDWLVK